jgi:hypothetical protein
VAQRGRLALTIVAVVAALTVLGLVLGKQGDGSGVGETIDLPVEVPRWPIEWESDHVVVFQSWTGTTTVRVDGTVISATRDPDSMTEGAFGSVAEDARFGRWKAWNGGRLLLGYADETCRALVPSPDGKFIACLRIVNDRGHETNEGFATVIRIQP